MPCLDFYIKQNQGEKWTPESPSSEEANHSYTTDVILVHNNCVIPNDMARRTAPTCDHSKHLYGQGHFRVWNPGCSSATVPTGCTSPPSYIPHTLNFLLFLLDVETHPYYCFDYKNILTKWIQTCLAIHWGLFSFLNICSEMWAEWWAQGKSSPIHLPPWGLGRIQTLCEEESC